MRLKGLEIQGFKSFKERTEFSFDDGITAIVGPNGCGKSNVVDAIRWILGEQRPTSLRSSEMQDVIFRGESGSFANFAEASLTFLNDRNLLPSEYHEICVTRRLYRTGESEYQINREPCRLRDIRELFLGTGVGVEAYSFMEQGKIDAILHSSPVQRRNLFDEAAGISRFKLKKKETLRNLEKVEANLQRVQDVEDELARRIHALKIQAGKARRYQELQEAIRAKKIAFSLVRYHDLVVERGQLVERREGLDAESGRAREALRDLETRLGGVRAESEQGAARASDLQAKILRAEGERRHLEEKLALTRQIVGELDLQGVEKRSALDEVEGREGESLRVLEETARQIEECDAEIVKVRAAFADRTAAFEGVSRELAETHRLTESLRGEALARLERRTRLQNRSVELEVEARGVRAQHARLAERLEELGAEVSRLAEEEARVALEDERLEAERAEADRRLVALEQELAQAVALRDERRRELADGERRETDRASRLSALRDMERKLVGVDAGVRAVLGAGTGEAPRLGGILGIVADLLTVSREHAPAIEAALAEKAALVVARTSADVRGAVDHLRDRCLGRAAFVALDDMKLPAPASDAPARDGSLEEGILGPATEFVRCESGHERLVRMLLGDVWLARSREPVEALRRRGDRRSFATVEGEWFGGGGIVRGGRGAGEGGLITQRAELRELAQELRAIRERIGDLRESVAAAERSIVGIEAGVAAARRDREAIEERRSRTRVARAGLAQRREHHDDEIRVGSEEQAELERAIRGAEEALRAVTAEVEALDREVQESEEKVSRQTSAERDLSSRRDALREECSRIRVDLAQAEARRDGLGRTHDARGRALAELRASLDRFRREIEAIVRRKAGAARDEIDLRESLARLEAEEAERARELEEAEGFLTGRRDATVRIESEIRDVEERRGRLREEVQGIELKLREVDVNERNLEERVREELGLSVADAYRDYRAEEVDLDAARREIEELRTKLERLGNVNLEAIEELAAEEERFASIHGQKTDLQEAANRLREVIRRLDRESREKFEATFQEIRANFREIFRKLFGGGSADVFLLEEEDVLDSGIEVVARPPGKELLSISLLSGGEKTMTAVALLFSIFSTRPSPFCLLDEVDAALDETNVQRFLSMVREFLDRSQFIIITHNKRTMGAADVLYGVTMEDRGISKKVSIDFRVGVTSESRGGNGNGNGNRGAGGNGPGNMRDGGNGKSGAHTHEEAPEKVPATVPSPGEGAPDDSPESMN